MEMMNRLIGDALDSKRFVDALNTRMEQSTCEPEPALPLQRETRQQRRARERAEAKGDRRATRA
ncbi:MAG: hypothetical protein V4706_01725 [Pseudomonadota bacterium]